MIGEVRIVYPPPGVSSMIAQGNLITSKGIRLQIDDGLYRLHLSNMIRISDQTAPPLPKIIIKEIQETGDGAAKGDPRSPPDIVEPETVSSPTSSGEALPPSSFSGVSEEGSQPPPSSQRYYTKAEIENFYNYGKRLLLRNYQKNFTGLSNMDKTNEELRDICLEYSSD